MGYIISEDCITCQRMGESLFKTEDGVDIFTGDYGYWCGYRNNHWIDFGKIKASKTQAKLLVGENIINKVFSSAELANEFCLKVNEIRCIGRWNDLPEKSDNVYYMGIEVGPNKKTLNTITVCVSHIEDNNITFDYIKTLMLENTFEKNRNVEIEQLIDEISEYFIGCTIYTEDGKFVKTKH